MEMPLNLYDFLSHELSYEIQIRGMTALGTVDEKRKILRGLLAQEASNRSFSNPPKQLPFFIDDPDTVLSLDQLSKKVRDPVRDETNYVQNENKQKSIRSLPNEKPNQFTQSNVISSTTVYDNLQDASNFDKENINSLNIQDSANSSLTSRKSPDDQLNYVNRSLTSVRSTSSLSTLVNGKLPIETTKTELLWGCVKPGKSVTQDVIIRNKSQSRLRIQCSLLGPSYKILRDRPDSEYASIARYVLQPGESKPISVSFSPIQVGAAVDAVSFTPSDSNLQQSKSQKILLYGYGGHGNVEISNITKDVTGKFWLCLGQLDNRTAVSQTIIVQNSGTIPSFAIITFESKDMYSFANINVSPSRFVLLPQEQKRINITYSPSRNDLKFFQTATRNSVIEIGVLKLIAGTEVNRNRIRRLSEQASIKGFATSPACKKLAEHIPGEIVPTDLNLFKESICGMTELLQELSIREVVVTLEQDPDCTLVAQFPDDTLQFQTLSQDTTLCAAAFQKQNFKLEPNCVILTPPSKVEDILLLDSDHNTEVPFEVNVDSSDIVASPNRGVVRPSESVIITVKCVASANRNKISSYKLCVLIDKCELECQIKVLNYKS